jgi:uncharacterized membrane protein YdjX (TVP38/TMEM64 family)
VEAEGKERVHSPLGRRRLLPRGAGLVALVLLFIALALAWRLTPLRQAVDIHVLTEWLGQWRTRPWLPLLVPLLYAAGGLLAIPLNAMTIATVLGFGPLLGGPLALIGGVANGVVGYAVGHRMGADRTQWLLGQRGEGLRRHLRQRGLAAVIAVRVIPVAPYTMVNVVAGAMRVRLDHYLLGTAIGLLPGVIALALLGEGVWALLAGASVHHALWVFAAAVMVLVVGLGLRRLLRHRQGSRPGD